MRLTARPDVTPTRARMSGICGLVPAPIEALCGSGPDSGPEPHKASPRAPRLHSTDAPRSAVGVDELALDQLAGRGARERVDEVDRAGSLVRRDAAAHVLDQLAGQRGRGLYPVADLHDRLDLLAHLGV